MLKWEVIHHNDVRLFSVYCKYCAVLRLNTCSNRLQGDKLTGILGCKEIAV